MSKYVLFLCFDVEPSTGVDPLSRRLLWNAILQAVGREQGVVLVSHVMEECEALCDVIAIMVQGKIVCLASPQQLRNQFGNEYIVSAVKTNSDEDLFEHLKGFFPDATLMKDSGKAIKFSFDISSMNLGKAFETMEQCKNKHIISSYSLSQITLNEVKVFLIELFFNCTKFPFRSLFGLLRSTRLPLQRQLIKNCKATDCYFSADIRTLLLSSFLFVWKNVTNMIGRNKCLKHR